eukprot:scaffold2125_cov126-Cylindrotheca_fusiformis.AAC.8
MQQSHHWGEPVGPGCRASRLAHGRARGWACSNRAGKDEAPPVSWMILTSLEMSGCTTEIPSTVNIDLPSSSEQRTKSCHCDLDIEQETNDFVPLPSGTPPLSLRLSQTREAPYQDM